MNHRWGVVLSFVVLLLDIPVHHAWAKQDEKTPVDYVNPYIGNISHLLVPTFPTIHLPNSMLRVYPERKDYTGNQMKGLPILVTNHREKSAFNLSLFQGDVSKLQPIIPFSYDHEVIKPYYYSVYLDDYDIQVEYAPSHQSAIYSFVFSHDMPSYLIINAETGELSANDQAVYGYQCIAGSDTKVYLYLETEQSALKCGVFANGKYTLSDRGISGASTIVLEYVLDTPSLNLRYGVSLISVEQAKRNLEMEINNYDLKALSEAGRRIWNEKLGKISVTEGSEQDKTVFYTSLYRTYERMICISEDGKYYSAFDGKVHNDYGIPFYTDDWIWDTYRAVHPLRVIIEPKMETDMISSFIRMAEQMEQFWMPTFPEITGDTRRMNSNHGVATVIDAYNKGLKGFDLDKAYTACYKAITEKTLAPWSAQPVGVLDRFYKNHGYFPALGNNESETVREVNDKEKRQPVAVTLGTVYDEWCLSQIAKQLGKEEDYKYFLQRSLNYKTIYNCATKFFHPKDSNGVFVEPFDYTRGGGQGARDAYGENNGWIYRWDVPHDIQGLIGLMGGKECFVDELERMYNTPLGDSKFRFYAQLPDHTGNVGQFSMANEPSLHIPYLYNYAGQPWRTQKRIRALLKQWFRNDVMGVPGDEDGGGLSAFVVFSMLGFYPVTPGLPMYAIGSPVFERMHLNLGNGKVFRITCNNYSPENKYIQSAKLNGVDWNKSWFTHECLVNGGELEFVMGKFPNKKWASSETSVPPSFEMIEEY